MTIKELEDKHSELIEVGLGNTEEELAEYWFSKQKEHTNLSIQFAISVLESLGVGRCYECDANNEIEYKIQELKQYLDETNKD